MPDKNRCVHHRYYKTYNILVVYTYYVYIDDLINIIV